MTFEKRTPEGHEQITGLTAAKSAAPPKGSRGALIVASGQPVRMRDDGNVPTATVGLLLAIGEVLDYQGNLNQLSFFQTAATGVIDILYYS